MIARAAVAAVSAGLLLAFVPASVATAAPLGPDDGTSTLIDLPPETLLTPRAAPEALALPPLNAAAVADPALLATVQRRSAQVEAAHETLAEQQAMLVEIRAELALHTEELAKLDETLSERQRQADQVARSAYMAARESPASLGSTPALMSMFPPTSRGLDQARTAVDRARTSFDSGAEVERGYAATVLGHEAEFDTAVTELTALRGRNEAEIVAQQAIQDAQRALAGRSARFGGTNSSGMAPNPIALKAVEFALSQRGKPYVFGAEGPDAYDCSGIVQTAYAEAGVKLPRTARPQWRATTPVAPADLLAGDLIFFGTDRSKWNSIYHVGIYLGANEILHAPMPGDVLRVAPMWWDEFFGASRVVPAVPGTGKPKPKPTQPAPAKPKPTIPPTKAPPTKPPPTTPAPAPSASATPPTTPEGGTGPLGDPSAPAGGGAPEQPAGGPEPLLGARLLGALAIRVETLGTNVGISR